MVAYLEKKGVEGGGVGGGREREGKRVEREGGGGALGSWAADAVGGSIARIFQDKMR